MDSYQLDVIVNAFYHNNYKYLGCFANDDYFLSENDFSNAFCILNTNSSNDTSIGHWIGFFSRNYDMIFIDSFGLYPEVYGGVIKRIYEKNMYRIKRLPNFQIQNELSLYCGAYVIFLIEKLCTDMHLGRIMRYFSRDICSNDCFIRKYILNFINNEILCYGSICKCKIFNTACSEICHERRKLQSR